MGMLYAETGDDKKAMNQINIAINPRKIKTIMLFQITLPICLIFILNRINLTKL
jgi:hypothetical protein